MASPIAVKPLSPADRDSLLALDQAAFGFDDRGLDPEADTAWIEWDRAFGAYREGVLAGIYVVFSYGLSVPAAPPAAAATTPMAGLSWVAVHPDHRRRGVLAAMMRHHLHTVHDGGREESLSGLFASEPRIYGRFGYGVASESRRLTLPGKAHLRVPRELGDVVTRFEAASGDSHAKIVTRVYDAACRQRPGLTVRPPVQWERHLADNPERRPGGAEALKILVAESAGEPTGYAVLRRTASHGDTMAEGKLRVIDLRALDPASGYALWRRLLDFDSISEVSTPVLPFDDPLVVWSGESHAGVRSADRFWVRIVDVAAALEARGYRSPVDVVLDVNDDVCPWNAGRWRLSADETGARCERTEDAPDLGLDVRELASAYLGGTSLETMARAGLVDERTSGTLVACSAAMRSSVLPTTPFMF